MTSSAELTVAGLAAAGAATRAAARLVRINVELARLDEAVAVEAEAHAAAAADVAREAPG
jgi:hypothetical protein